LYSLAIALPAARQMASAERVSHAFFIVQSLKPNWALGTREGLLPAGARPQKDSNFRTKETNVRFKCTQLSQ
jgi:hypothetical protein